MRTFVIALFVLFATTNVVWANTNNDNTAESDENTGSASIVAQEIVAPDTVHAGDSVLLKLQVQHDKDSEVVISESTGSNRLRLIQKTQVHTDSEVRRTSAIEMTFLVNRPGEAKLKSFEIGVIAQGKSQTLTTEPVAFKVISKLGDTTDLTLKPTSPPREIWVEDYTIAWIGGVVATFGLFGLVAFFLFTRREIIEIPPPPRPAHDIALEKLNILSKENAFESLGFMNYYVDLSEAVREYLGERYDFPGVEYTAREIKKELRDVTWPNGLSITDINEFLDHTDSVKFGGVEPSFDSAQTFLRRGYSIVELTKRKLILDTLPGDKPIEQNPSSKQDEQQETPAPDKAVEESVDAQSSVNETRASSDTAEPITAGVTDSTSENVDQPSELETSQPSDVEPPSPDVEEL